MRERGLRGRAWYCVCLYLLVSLASVSQARGAEEPPYEFNAQLSLTGGCGTSKPDPIPDPGCPEKKPPKPFTSPRGIGIDSFGDEYVASFGAEEGKQGRVDFFNPKGVFIGEVKDELGPRAVAVDSKGVLYTFDQSPGHDAELGRYKPTVYKPAEEDIEYGPREVIDIKSGPTAGGITIDGNDHLFVDWQSSIREYSSAEEGNEVKNTITDPKLQSSAFITLDRKRRRLYVSSCPNGDISECWILVFDVDTHKLLKEVEGTETAEGVFKSTKGWISVAVDEESGDFFVGDLEVTKNVYQFNEDYELVSTLKQDPALFEGGEAMQIAVSNAVGAFNARDLLVPSLKNRALAYSPPQEKVPAFGALSVTNISEEEAELLATIKPRGGTTTYRFEYLSEEEWEEAGEGFAGAKVAGEGTILPDESEAEVSAALAGLSPGTPYRARLIAENAAGEAEDEITFTTYSDASITNECPEAIRTTYSALLPDCRAFELVTPANTNGRPPRGVGFGGDQFNTLEASPVGNVVSFLTEGGVIPGLGGTGSLIGDLYRTTRTKSGWSTESAGPSGEETISAVEGSTSLDQGYSFWQATREGSAVIEGVATHYVRYPDGHSELIGRGSLGTDPSALGRLITANGSHIVWTIDRQLEPDAPPTGTTAVYDRTSDEVTHVVSLLPGDEMPEAGEDAQYIGASPDGEGIAFRIGNRLYLRVGNATTFEIGEGVEFGGVTEGGERIFYVEGGDLFAFDTETEAVIPFGETGNAVPVNVSNDGSRAYFVSTTAIEGSGENPNGSSAEVGKQNLYLSEEGTLHFVGTVTARDVNGEKDKNNFQVDGLGLWRAAVERGELARDPSRTTPDGTVLLFSSRADLDGYAHEGVPEIYRYDSTGNRLHCISCIPTRTPVSGGSSLESNRAEQDEPEPFSTSGFIPNLRADGKRVIFQSTEALVSYDNDGVQDVYEWEEEGQGSCTSPGGCIYLISSGRSTTDNYLYGLSASGNDVFFITTDVLVGSDDDTASIYDARVNGGFEELPCQKLGECPNDKPLTPAPLFPAPESEGVAGPPPPTHVKPCPKGKHRVTRNGKQVCAKNHRHQKKHHAKKKGRAGK